MAVFYLVVMTTGCATSRQVSDLREEVRLLQVQQRQSMDMISRIDSTIAESAESNNRLRANISTTVDQLGQQISMLLENYNELVEKLDKLARRPQVITRLKDSPGAQTGEPAGGGKKPTEKKPSIDCGVAYDESFILVRRGEYDKAIEGFRHFLSECPKHESVENAYYWIGESYYAMEKYTDAVSEFAQLIEDYPGSVNVGRALYKLGRSKQELNDKAGAKKAFQKLVNDHGGTLEAEQAAERLKDLK